jgi:hypothetical protein
VTAHSPQRVVTGPASHPFTELRKWPSRNCGMSSMLWSGGGEDSPACVEQAGTSRGVRGVRAPRAHSGTGIPKPVGMFEGLSASLNGASRHQPGSPRIGGCTPAAHQDALQPPGSVAVFAQEEGRDGLDRALCRVAGPYAVCAGGGEQRRPAGRPRSAQDEPGALCGGGAGPLAPDRSTGTGTGSDDQRLDAV